MTRVATHGEFLRDQTSLCYHDCEHLAEEMGLPHDPDARVLVSYGGDGTLLCLAEKYVGRILLPVRHREGGPYRYCPLHGPANIGGRLRDGERYRNQLAIWFLPKISVINGGKSYRAINEVCILNENRASAIRTRVESRDGYAVSSVGDGVIISTPYGSSGYFRSVAKGTFRYGTGVAFVNDCDNNGWFVSDAVIEVRIERGPAIMTVDNRHIGRVNDSVIIHMTGEATMVAGLDALFCNECLDHDGLPAGRRHV